MLVADAKVLPSFSQRLRLVPRSTKGSLIASLCAYFERWYPHANPSPDFYNSHVAYMPILGKMASFKSLATAWYAGTQLEA
jgi:hypothetical protein